MGRKIARNLLPISSLRAKAIAICFSTNKLYVAAATEIMNIVHSRISLVLVRKSLNMGTPLETDHISMKGLSPASLRRAKP
jgi:hypothetical protein